MQPLRQAAVLIPLNRGPDRQLQITLIERSPTLPTHPGQIAFDDLLASPLLELAQ